MSQSPPSGASLELSRVRRLIQKTKGLRMIAPAHSTPQTTDWVRVFWRRRRRAAAVFLAVLAIAIAYQVLAPRSYRSEGKLLVRLGRENAMLDPTVAPGQQGLVAVPQSREDEINSIVEVLRSRALMEGVVDDLGPAAILGPETAEPKVPVTTGGVRGWATQAASQARRIAGGAAAWVKLQLQGTPSDDREQAVQKLEKSLRVQSVRRSNVVEISCDSYSPEQAQKIVNAVVDRFRNEHLRLNRANGTREFFETQAAQTREQLEQITAAIRDLKSSASVTAADDQRRLLAAKLSQFEVERDRVTTAQAASAARIAALRSKLAQLSPTETTAETSGVGNLAADTMRSQLYALEMQEKEYASKYTDNHPRLIELRRKLAEAREVYSMEEPTRTQVTVAPSKAYQEVQTAILAEEPKLAALQAEAEGLQLAVARTREEIRAMNEADTRLVQLQREADLLETAYKRLSAGLEEARIDEALQGRRMSNISVVQQASFEPKAVWPAPIPVLALGLAIGGMGAFAAVVLAERHDRRVYSLDDIELPGGEPALAAMPRFEREPLQHAAN